MDKRIGVEAFHGRAGPIGIALGILKQGPGGTQHKGPEPFPPGEQGMGHRRAQAIGNPRLEFGSGFLLQQGTQARVQPLGRRFQLCSKLAHVKGGCHGFGAPFGILEIYVRSTEIMAGLSGKSRRKVKADERTATRPRRWRRAVIWAIRIGVVMILIPALLVPLYSKLNPPASMLMIIRLAQGATINRQWVPLDSISPFLVRSALVAEDGRFCSHSGIDLKELWASLRSASGGARPRGASTITMQTVKNLFLWPGRSYVRKGIEVPLALYADLVWSKRRTMEIYLNIAEWGEGIFGAEAAARHYFGVPAARLNLEQSARLATALPDPHGRNPAKPGARMARLAKLYAQRARLSGAYIGCLSPPQAAGPRVTGPMGTSQRRRQALYRAQP